MKKRRRLSRRINLRPQPISWLPIDSRILPPIFSFGRVKGIARIFLEIEIVLSILIVLGTLAVVFLSLVK